MSPTNKQFIIVDKKTTVILTDACPRPSLELRHRVQPTRCRPGLGFLVTGTLVFPGRWRCFAVMTMVPHGHSSRIGLGSKLLDSSRLKCGIIVPGAISHAYRSCQQQGDKHQQGNHATALMAAHCKEVVPLFHGAKISKYSRQHEHTMAKEISRNLKKTFFYVNDFSFFKKIVHLQT